MTEPRPCSAIEAVARARTLLAHPSNLATGYFYGTGNYKPITLAGRPIDVPWTEEADKLGRVHTGSDCAGFAICWCYKLPRHRPGYNRGAWASIEDDINCNSAIEDAEHARDLFVLVEQQAVNWPQPGDLLCYPTFRIEGHPRPWIGHVGIVLDTVRAAEWDGANPQYQLLDVAQCCGPDERKPAVLATDGSAWMKHDHDWPKPEHRTRLLRARP